ncbi:MAG: acetyl-CoA carboxylase biotin carboxylase subunit [Deltaproteobacteria bacterium]|nr:acetyl-CoA carboxylase biotin carboxylase subunit [Deltaproteobacteria bacterium]
MFKRVLIANRGEIAVRIIRSLRDLGIESVALFSDVDRQCMHVSLADFAIHLPGQNSLETYLNVPKIIRCIRESGADGVHPGYGFLAENAEFAEAIEAQTSAKFIGPSPSAIRLMGDKIGARNLMQKQGVPIVPGCDHAIAGVGELEEIAKSIGFPLILKAAGGGGGRGMRIVNQRKELADAFESCQREAQAAFGRADVFCESYLQKPRHIEFQIFCDQFGNGVHLFERECSIQRRHQKLFEEAPSAFLSKEQREHYGAIAVKAAQAAGYHGTGTVEFIGENPDKLFFMEMNTRIQVEHPVTEMITGTDIVAEQIRIAGGEPLSIRQENLSIHGWSMEARINAEDPARGFMPQSGRIKRLHLPAGPHVRVDTHLTAGYDVPSTYDSLLAKLVVWGRTREEAMARMRSSLQEFLLEGVANTISFHEALLIHPAFQRGNIHTHFIADEEAYFANKARSRVEHVDDDVCVLLAGLMTLEESNFKMEPPVGESHWKRLARSEATKRE